MTDLERLWTVKEVAAHIGVHPKTVRKLRVPRVSLPGTGKRPLVRFDPAQVIEWWGAYRSKKPLRGVGA